MTGIRDGSDFQVRRYLRFVRGKLARSAEAFSVILESNSLCATRRLRCFDDQLGRPLSHLRSEKDAAFDAFAKKDFRSLRQKLFTFSVALHIQIFAFRKDASGLAGRQLVGAVEIGEFFRLDPGDSRIFIVAHCLAGDDLPDAVALQPRVGYVITRGKLLAKDSFCFVEIVTQNSRVTVNDTFGLHDLDRARITFRQGRNIGNQLSLVQATTLFIGKNAILGEVFLPWLLIARYYRVEKFLCAANKFLLRYCCRISAN